MTDQEIFEREWSKMLTGKLYEAAHPEFQRRLTATRNLIQEYNNIKPDDFAALDEMLTRILGSRGKCCQINQPFRCDYGCNIHVGEGLYANFNLTILDEAEVRIGRNAFIGPNVSMYTACHPIDPDARRNGDEWAEPISIGDDVWIGGNVTILPGVAIGNGAVIGAGSVVVHNVEPLTVVAGNPARLIKRIEPAPDCAAMPDDSDELCQLGLDSCGD